MIHAHGGKLGEIPPEHRRVLNAITSCRTAALGGHVEACDRCGHRRIAYNSCRNRHCPKCQASACAQWMNERAKELLPVEYFHVVFTLPGDFNALALANPRIVYGLLFDAAAQTLLEVAANPRHLGARIGFLSILHTWGQNLCLHPHVHCVVPGGGLSLDGSSGLATGESRWVACRRGYFLPVRVLSRVFRGKFIAGLKRAHQRQALRGIDDEPGLQRLLDGSVRREWVVYAKPPFGSPQQVLKYLSRYTHRIAIGNRRLVAMDQGTVTFRWKDYAHHDVPRLMTLNASEFLRRFLLHVVPRGFVRIRHYGLLANRHRAGMIQRCRVLIGAAAAIETPLVTRVGAGEGEWCRCPECHEGRMVPGPWLSPQQVLALAIRWDSS
ncbi:MAG: IS91 family transposase [Actinobacteria bacterium]|nr:IS91 family transposase [Actinomycetota bacterium]